MKDVTWLAISVRWVNTKIHIQEKIMSKMIYYKICINVLTNNGQTNIWAWKVTVGLDVVRHYTVLN